VIVSPFRTSVTAAHQDFNKRVDPDLTNRRAKPGAPKASKDDAK
jgi:hypothetical protein